MKPISALFLGALTLAAQTSVVTYHNDNARTGRYLSETLLTPAAVKAGPFGKRWLLPVDGYVYAQPLYLSRVKIAGKGLRNVLFVATSNDSVYAFDADDESPAGTQPLWKVSFIDPAQGITTVSAADVGCGAIPELGIIGTPVIDPQAGTIYLIAFTKETGGDFMYRLQALDVTSGAERPGSPVVIQPPAFVPLAHKQRAALLLSNGVVYSPWSGHCDLGTYHGWIMAHNASTLQLTAAFNTTPGDRGASFWNGGAGPAADEQGNIYVVSANGDFDGNSTAARYDESVLRLLPSPGLTVADQFTPFNKAALDEEDLDLGSSGAVLLPPEAGSAAHPHLLFTSGKEARMYLLDAEALGGVQSGTDSGALSSQPAVGAHGTYGSAAYFNGSIYIGPGDSPMIELPLANASLGSPAAATAQSTNLSGGTTPSISANGSGNGIVWVVSPDDGCKLLAFDASNLSTVFDSSVLPSNRLPGCAEFSIPTIADGKVFAGTMLGVAVYAETTSQAPVVASVANAASYAADAISPGSLIVVFGANLAATTSNTAAVAPLPLSIGDSSVTIDGFVAPVLFSSPGQINVQVPWEVPAGPATVMVRTRGTVSQAMKINVQSAAPGVFTEPGGYVAALNADGSPNSVSNPATSGSVVSVFFTGQGPIASPVDDGATPATGQTILATLPISASIGDLPAQVQGAALSPENPGVAQLSLKIPALASGVYPLIVNIAGKASNSAQLAISGP